MMIEYMRSLCVMYSSLSCKQEGDDDDDDDDEYMQTVTRLGKYRKGGQSIKK